MQGDCRSQCWGWELEAKTGASQQGRAGHQGSCASVASPVSCFWEALLELQPGASPGWALAEHRGHSVSITFVCWPWTIIFSANNSQNLRGTRLLFDCMTSRRDRRIFLYYSLQHTMESKQPMLIREGE